MVDKDKVINRNAYEIRTDVLEMAKDICLRQHQSDAAKNYDNYAKEAVKNHENVIPYNGPTSAPSTDEILAVAIRLNSFISNPDNVKEIGDENFGNH